MITRYVESSVAKIWFLSSIKSKTLFEWTKMEQVRKIVNNFKNIFLSSFFHHFPSRTELLSNIASHFIIDLRDNEMNYFEWLSSYFEVRIWRRHAVFSYSAAPELQIKTIWMIKSNFSILSCTTQLDNWMCSVAFLLSSPVWQLTKLCTYRRPFEFADI